MSASFMQVKVEAQIKPIATHLSALTSTVACSSLLAAALLEEFFQHPQEEG